MEPQRLWIGSLRFCLVEHQGLSRRLRLVLTSQTHLVKGEQSLLSSTQCMGGYTDRCTEPDWYVLPDGHQPNAWKLLHAACKGGDRFRALGQAGDAANKAKHHQFESLHHKTYFYDAWRWKIELNQPESPLRLLPRPELCKRAVTGSFWQSGGTIPPTHRTQESASCEEMTTMSWRQERSWADMPSRAASRLRPSPL